MLELKGFGRPNDFEERAASDTLALPSRIISVRVGSVAGGAVVVVTNSQDDLVTFNNVGVGTDLPIPGAKLLMATDTTASSFVIYTWR